MKEIFQQSDEDLMLSVQKGDMAAFEELYARYQKRLYHFILRFVREIPLAEDILQETFLRLLKGRKQYRKGYRFSTYLFKIARNLCLDTLKSWEKRNLLKDRDDLLTRSPDPSKDPYEKLESAEAGKIVQEAILNLSHDQREVLLLSKYSRLSYEEIAAITESTSTAVKQKVYRAMLSLKQALKNLVD